MFGVLVKLYSPLGKIHLWLKSQSCPPARESITVGAGKCSFLVCFVCFPDDTGLAIPAHVWLSQYARMWTGAADTGTRLLCGPAWLVTYPCPGSLPLRREEHAEHRLSIEPEELPPTPHHLEEQSVQAESGHKENPPEKESLQSHL